MRKFFRFTLAGVFVSMASTLSAVADNNNDSLPVLSQESQHSAAAKRVSKLFSRAHYSDVKFDDNLSREVFKQYLKRLDYNRNILLQSDINAFLELQSQFDEAINSGIFPNALRAQCGWHIIDRGWN